MNIGGAKTTKSLMSVTPRALPGHQRSGMRVPVQPTPRDLMYGIYAMPVSRLRGGLFCFKEVIYIWIIVGYILCKVTKTAGCQKLYTASRHPNDRCQDLFKQH